MPKHILLLCALSWLAAHGGCGPAPSNDGGTGSTTNPANPRVAIETSKGRIVVEVFDVQAPASVQNFLDLAESGGFDGTIVHSINGQEGMRGGLYQADLTVKTAVDPVKNESNSGLSNRRGYVAMVEPTLWDSAGLEWVIYTNDVSDADYGTPFQTRGRSVFARVVDGMAIVDAIVSSEIKPDGAETDDGKFLEYLPLETVTITRVDRLDANGDVIARPARPRPAINIAQPRLVTESTGDRTPVDLGTVTATDADGVALAPTNDAPAGGFVRGITDVTWTATDTLGATARRRQRVIVTGPTITTASGLKYQEIVVGIGPAPTPNAQVLVNYLGELEDGTVFDGNHASVFSLNGVIPGFAEGIQTMGIGGSRRLIIPPDIGYGPAGQPPKIPPNATLIFYADLLDYR